MFQFSVCSAWLKAYLYEAQHTAIRNKLSVIYLPFFYVLLRFGNCTTADMFCTDYLQIHRLWWMTQRGRGKLTKAKVTASSTVILFFFKLRSKNCCSCRSSSWRYSLQKYHLRETSTWNNVLKAGLESIRIPEWHLTDCVFSPVNIVSLTFYSSNKTFTRLQEHYFLYTIIKYFIFLFFMFLLFFLSEWHVSKKCMSMSLVNQAAPCEAEKWSQ